MQSENRELGSKSIIALVGQVIGQVFAFLLTILAGRLLGAEQYGKVIYSYTIMTFFIIVTKMGFENSLVSFLSREDWSLERKKGCIVFAVKCSLTMSILIILLLFWRQAGLIAIIGNSGITVEIILVMAPMILLETIIMVLASIIRAERRIKEYYLATLVVKNGIRLLGFLVMYFILHISNIFALIISYYLSYFCMLIYCFYCFRRSKYKKVYALKISSNEILSFSLPLLLSGIVATLNTEVDRYMLGYSINSKNVGIYNIALNIGHFASFTLIAVNSIFAPMISSLFYGGNREKLQYLYAKATKWILTINIMIFGMVMAFSKDIMRLAGDEYVIGGIVLVIIVFGQLINSGVGSVGYLNIMTGHPKWDMSVNIISVIVNVFLNVALIPEYGMVGAAVASAASVGIYNIVSFILMYRNLHMHPYNIRYLGIVLALIIMLPILLFLKNILHINYIVRLIVCGLFYVVGYGSIIYWAVCDKEEKLLVRRLIERINRRNE